MTSQTLSCPALRAFFFGVIRMRCSELSCLSQLLPGGVGCPRPRAPMCARVAGGVSRSWIHMPRTAGRRSDSTTAETAALGTSVSLAASVIFSRSCLAEECSE